MCVSRVICSCVQSSSSTKACAPRWITTNYNPPNQNDPTALYEQQVRGICYASGRSLTGFTALRACTGMSRLLWIVCVCTCMCVCCTVHVHVHL